MCIGTIGQSYFWARETPEVSHGRSIKPRGVGRANFGGKYHYKFFLLESLNHRFNGFLLLVWSRLCSIHSTGIIISFSVGAHRTASRFAKNLMSCRTDLMASYTATPSAIPEGWLGISIALPAAVYFSSR